MIRKLARVGVGGGESDTINKMKVYPAGFQKWRKSGQNGHNHVTHAVFQTEAEAAPGVWVLRPHRAQWAGEVPEGGPHAPHQESNLANATGTQFIIINDYTGSCLILYTNWWNSGSRKNYMEVGLKK